MRTELVADEINMAVATRGGRVAAGVVIHRPRIEFEAMFNRRGDGIAA